MSRNKDTYVNMPQLYNLGTDEDPYIRYCYIISHVAEFMNVQVPTLRGWIKKEIIPETPILLPYSGKNPKINFIRLYIWEQFEGLHLGLLKYRKGKGFNNRNKHWMYKFVLEEWQKIPHLQHFKPSDFLYKPLAKK